MLATTQSITTARKRQQPVPAKEWTKQTVCKRQPASTIGRKPTYSPQIILHCMENYTLMFNNPEPT